LRLGSVLEKIAEQGTRVTIIESNQEILFERIRELDTKAAEARTSVAVEQTKVGFLVTGIAAIVSVVSTITVKILFKS